MSDRTRAIEQYYVLKEAEHKERKPVDRWFLGYCKWYASLCQRVKEGE